VPAAHRRDLQPHFTAMAVSIVLIRIHRCCVRAADELARDRRGAGELCDHPSGFAGLALDIRDRRRAELETDRMRGLANAAVEGLIVCDGDTVATVTTASRSWPRWPIRKPSA